jgi:parallel beta-helix repeat protein
MLLPAIVAAALLGQPEHAHVVSVSRDDTVIDRSCIVRIEPGAVIADANGDGVIHIRAGGITVAFEEGSVLRGGPDDADPDRYAGIGIRLDGHRDVTIRAARVRGFKVGLRATECDGLTIEGGDWSGNYRQRLRSTPAAEDASDWLFPHENDQDQWTLQHGAAISIRRGAGLTLRDVLVRHGQNGIILDRVNDSRVFDNDCSFLSGWGLAMWRSSRNTIDRNALDFCIRGYSHGVYNRGQDSAGLLMFEQCDDNVIAENSITHGGDGIFGFAGKEAIGEAAAEGFNYRGAGNARNIIVRNDLSAAAAHGLEMTFSHGCIIAGNRFYDNAICGIWGGYSQDFVITGNRFESNGGMAYGLERGGINIEHGAGNLIVDNQFEGNRCGVHLWWDDDGALLRRPGVRANYRGVEGNVVARNRFTGDAVALHLRDASPGLDMVRGTIFADNALEGVNVPVLLEPASIPVSNQWDGAAPAAPQLKLNGQKHVVGARQLTSRANIIMTEWGPWDHQEPLALFSGRTAAGDRYVFYRIAPADIALTGGARLALTGNIAQAEAIVAPGEGSVAPYTLVAEAAGYRKQFSGVAIRTTWDLTIFPWQGDGGPHPPADLEAWRALADSPRALRASLPALDFAFGGGGPSQAGVSPEVTAAGLKPDYFGIIARTRLALPAGRWVFRTLSDDGIRVLVNGRPLIENWTHHGATWDSGVFESDGTEAEIRVEYFEIFGAAVLKVEIEPER